MTCFDEIIDFLDKRNEINLTSHSRVFDNVPRGKLGKQDKYLNSKTREGDGTGQAERQSTGLGRSQEMPLRTGLQPDLGDNKNLLSRQSWEASLIQRIISIAHGENRALPRKEPFCPTTVGWRGGKSWTEFLVVQGWWSPWPWLVEIIATLKFCVWKALENILPAGISWCCSALIFSFVLSNISLNRSCLSDLVSVVSRSSRC